MSAAAASGAVKMRRTRAGVVRPYASAGPTPDNRTSTSASGVV